ncbi:M81 family metallopeptidase [Limobrevibacterium gyesilva]|uniref:Microcystinase C n=1 Tax=Limobrevibacterium gyesilva TaxID=2991712 RepID=A0AA41YKN7_9PROT|nr:M81 family metallopeptidase [Limobrevibacterium gyesilva]MCW3475536.1 M81 family metallopeptidase [Limobrevibacterium gyesilva]
MTRVLLAGLFHETHCFTDDVTGMDGFTIRRGDAIIARRGDGSQLDGFLSVAEREGWTVIPAVDYGAFPSGIVDHAVFEAFWSELGPILRAAVASGLDAIFLGLHGAMVTTGQDDPEGELLRQIRAIPGAEALPLFGVFDLHATLTPAMCALADGLVCYRENPHTDAFDAAVRAADLLAGCLRRSVRPRMRFRGTPIILPPTGTGTADRPMRDLEALARVIEAETPSILAMNVVGGFCFADAHDAGMSFAAITEDDAAAEAALDRLASLAWSLRHHGLPAEDDPDDVLRRIPPGAQGPVLLVEPADNIGGGSPGDCTDVLRAMLRHDVQGGGVILADAPAAAALQEIPIGGTVRLAFGGRGSRLDPGPVELDVTLLSRSDGRFMLEDRHSHLAASQGVHIDMGPCAVVRHRGITILLTTRKTPPWDLGQWRSQGIEPTALAVINIKAAVAHRRAYDPIAAASYTVRTRGPCTSDPRALPYARLRRPIFPLDDADRVRAATTASGE